MASQGDNGPTVSMTYAELAKALSIEVASAQRQVFRKKWERTKGNDGMARVNVPLSAIPDTIHDGQKDKEAKPQPASLTVGATAMDDSQVVIQRLLDRMEAMDATMEAERTRWAKDRSGWEADRADWSLERDTLAKERATLREELARREGELTGLREALARPAPAPLRDALDRLRAWIEAKARRS